MADVHSNLLLSDLRQQIVAGSAVAFVGAGVSIATTNRNEVASWIGLLKHGVQRCIDVVPGLASDWAARVTQDIESGDLDDLLTAAEKITRKLKAQGGEFRRWLKETIGELKVEDDSIVQALHSLNIPIITTNYDDLIEQVTRRRPVTWREHHELEHLLRKPEEVVLHLHGHWRDPDTVVLGTGSYDEILKDEFTQSFMRSLRLAQSILYIGFGAGLEDPNFSALLEWARRLFHSSEFRHFRLSLRGDLESLQGLHGPADRIYVLPYGDRYDQLAGFLRSLVPSVPMAEPSTLTAKETFGQLTDPKIPGFRIRAQNVSVNNINDLIIAFQNSFSLRWEPADPLAGSPLVYWPVRLRPPTPIHAMQCFVAAGLQRQGAQIYLCLDEYGRQEYPPDRFFAAIRRWIKRVGGDGDALKTERFSELVGSTMKDAWENIQKWLGMSPYDLKRILMVSKLWSPDESESLTLDSLVMQRPKRLLTPPVVWTCLAKIRKRDPDKSRPVITLGGYDEQPLWECWRECIDKGSPVDHLYIPKLNKLDPGHGERALQMEHDPLDWVSKENIQRFITMDATAETNPGDWAKPERMITWSLVGCVLLPDFVASGFSCLKVADIENDASPAAIIGPLVNALDKWLLRTE